MMRVSSWITPLAVPGRGCVAELGTGVSPATITQVPLGGPAAVLPGSPEISSTSVTAFVSLTTGMFPLGGCGRSNFLSCLADEYTTQAPDELDGCSACHQ